MNTCVTCKHWKRKEAELINYSSGLSTWIAGTTQPEYEAARQFFKETGKLYYGYCDCPKLAYEQIPITKDGLSCMDAEYYRAWILTGENFGCIHHEPA